MPLSIVVDRLGLDSQQIVKLMQFNVAVENMIMAFELDKFN